MKLEWFKNNSAALQGAAAVTVLLATVVSAAIWLYRNVGSDIVIIKSTEGSSVPPALVDWVKTADALLLRLGYENGPEAEKMKTWEEMKSWQEMKASRFGREVAKGLRFNSSTGGVLHLTVRNTSDHSISGLRLRLDRLSGVWDITAGGSFLTADELQSFLKRADFSSYSTEMVLPELPAIPEHSTLEISVYGGVEFAELSVSGAAARTTIKNIVCVEDNWFIFLYRTPGGFIWLALMLAFVGMSIATLIRLRRPD